MRWESGVYDIEQINALIPVPIKGTIQSTEALMSAFTILIPVPVKGTIIRLAHFYFAYIALIPVSTKGTIKLTKKGKINYPL